MSAYVDDWATTGSDAPQSQTIGFGMVQWDDGRELSLPFIAGLANTDDPDAHPNERWAPFLFPSSNSGATTGDDLLEAWDALIYAGQPGFRQVDPDEIRVVDHYKELRVYPRALLLALGDERVFDSIDG